MNTEVDRLSLAVDEAARRELLSTEAPRSKFKVVVIIDRVIEALGAALMLGITGILFANTISRYLFNNPLPWVSEIAPQMIVWVSVLGMYISLRRNDLLTVHVLTKKLSPLNRMRWNIITNLISVGVMAALAWFGFRYLQQFGGDLTPLLRLPKGVFITAIPLGVGALSIAFLADAWRVYQAGPEAQVDPLLDGPLSEEDTDA